MRSAKTVRQRHRKHIIGCVAFAHQGGGQHRRVAGGAPLDSETGCITKTLGLTNLLDSFVPILNISALYRF